jgi:hypothetical protein
MAAIAETYYTIKNLELMLQEARRNGKGISITTNISDKTNEYGQNTSSFVSQNKEEREKKIPKLYVSNGKIIWTDGIIHVAEKKDKPKPKDDLPTPAQKRFDEHSDITPTNELPF